MALKKDNTKKQEETAAEPKVTVSARDAAKQKADEAKAKADQKAKEKAEKDEAKAKEKEEAAEKKAKEKEEAAEKKAKEKEEAAEKREAMKGLSKLLRSFLARIKYMVYMDNPAAGIEGIENLTWSLSIINSNGETITVTRGENTNEIAFTVVDAKKKKTTGTSATDTESLEALFATWEA